MEVTGTEMWMTAEDASNRTAVGELSGLCHVLLRRGRAGLTRWKPGELDLAREWHP